jgi:hypothetical protein
LSLTPSVGAHFEFSAPNNLGLLKSSDKNDNPATGALAEPAHQPVEPARKPGLVVAHATLEAQHKGERGGKIFGAARAWAKPI